MREVVLSIDSGTQSSRVFLYDKDQRVLSSSQKEFRQIYPKPGWCEHDPWDIMKSVQDCIEGALENAGPGIHVTAIGVTNQRETTLVWSRSTGLPLHNAVVWLDTRTAGICDKMAEELGKDYYRPVTGLPISTYFSGFKLKWLIDHVEAVRDAVRVGDAMFGTVDTWIVYNLTGGVSGGVHVTDLTNASRTFMMDLGRLEWDERLMGVFGASRDMMPKIVSCAEVVGHVASGPLAGRPLCGMLGDQHAALLGQRCVEGEAKNTYGTGCFMLLNTGPRPIPSSHGLLTTVAFRLGPSAPPQYALEGAVAVAGVGVSWLRDGLGIIGSAQESETLAASVPDTAGVFFVPAFTGLLAPHWRDDARGVIVGLTQYTTKAHIARALLEGVCLQVRDCLTAMRRDCRTNHFDLHIRRLRVDGGMTKNNLLLQMQADVLGSSVLRPHHQETTSLGAALAAGMAVGFYSEADVFGKACEGDTEFDPRSSQEQRLALLKGWKGAVGRSFGLAGPHGGGEGSDGDD